MRRIIAIATVATVLLLLGLAQLLLPGIAAQTLRDRLAKSGTVLSVRVDAFPAIELLWHQADKVVIRMASYQSSTGHLSSLIAQAGDAGALDGYAGTMRVGLLTLHGAALHKRGDELTATAQVTESDLRTAIPLLQSVTPVASSGGGLTFRGTLSLFGLSVDATVEAVSGNLVVPFGPLTITLFSNPHVYVQSVGASPTAQGFSVSASGRLH